jgi:U3 small nucleolar RNA-associated protein 19
VAVPSVGSARVVDEEEDDDSSDDDKYHDGEADDSSSESESENESESNDDNNIGAKRKRDSSTASTSANKRSRKSSSGKPTWQQSTKHRRVLQESWLAVLKIPALPNRALKQALQHLPTAILPIVSAPLRFADVCTRAYEVGGVTSFLALHSLFVLMMDHGLEYPKFYASLYRLVTSRNFYAKHRTRFFRLLTNCLAKSDMLPAYVVAAFCKRLARCALTAPPSGALFVLALISNLLRRHGECACLVHRGTGRGDDASLEDKFDADAQDPAHARALESSLWELAALERHCHPAVSALASSVGTENEKTPMYDMDEFLLHTYKSLFETERKRINQKKRMAVPLTFEKPKSLFTDNDIFAGLLSVPRPAGEKDSDGTH